MAWRKIGNLNASWGEDDRVTTLEFVTILKLEGLWQLSSRRLRIGDSIK